jgi:hypothetical protein
MLAAGMLSPMGQFSRWDQFQGLDWSAKQPYLAIQDLFGLRYQVLTVFTEQGMEIPQVWQREDRQVQLPGILRSLCIAYQWGLSLQGTEAALDFVGNVWGNCPPTQLTESLDVQGEFFQTKCHFSYYSGSQLVLFIKRRD